MRTVNSIASGWLFCPDFRNEYTAATFSPKDWQKVCLPHTNREVPFNGFDEKEYQFVSTYTRNLVIPTTGKRFFLDFDGVMCACDIWINGTAVGAHKGGYTPFSIEITRFVSPGETIRLVVRVDSTERDDVPPFGHVVDYLCFGGIYRDVFLRTQDEVYINSVFARPEKVLESEKALNVDIDIAGPEKDVETYVNGRECNEQLSCTLLDGARIVNRVTKTLEPITSTGMIHGSLRLEKLCDLRLWDTENPTLYTLVVRIDAIIPSDEKKEEKEDESNARYCIDEYRVPVGFRTVKFTPEGFFLNGQKMKLYGLNRHQSWPYVGYAMPERAQRRDAEILKNEFGVNLVRTSHYPQSPYFLEACDEMGLLVLEELPGWQYIGDAAWKNQACIDLESMILRDRNHPAIILWGVRINESQDDHDFYMRTNELARALDPTRPHGGIRYVQKSELLEDVYTFNDFSYTGGKNCSEILLQPRTVTGLRHAVPYLVTEHTGHMFPTKRFDHEDRLREHALRHARILNATFGNPRISGAIGWCAFDYNTHKDFGSGDRICYHGVADGFRMPKYAAFVYASQTNPEKKPVLEPATLFAKGERNAAHILPIEIWTNCESVILCRGGKDLGEYFPDKKEFPYLPHPPIIITDFISDQLLKKGYSAMDLALLRKLIKKILEKGENALNPMDMIQAKLFMLRRHMPMDAMRTLIADSIFGWGRKDERFELAGYVGGKEVLRKTYGGDAYAVRLEVKADDTELHMPTVGAGWDTTRITVRALDQYGNLHPFTQEAITISVEGAGEIIGPSVLPLAGGCIAFWIRTVDSAEEATFIDPTPEITVRVISERFGENKVLIKLI